MQVTGTLRRRLGRLLRPAQRFAYYRLQQAAIRDLTRATRSVTGALPLWVAVSVKEGISRTSQLDYRPAPISMEITTATQIDRLYACAKEPETVAWIEQHIRPGDVFYDIGANVGAYALIADAAAEGRARIYAFEPGAATYAALAQNVFVNRCSGRVVPLPLALARQTSLRSFHYSSLIPGAASHVMPDDHVRAGNAVAELVQPVITFSIDDMIARLGVPAPTLIKIDVDGVEFAVLQGAEQTLRSPELRTLLVEVGEQDATTPALVQLLESCGYVFQERHHHTGPGDVANYIFVRRSTDEQY